MPAEIGPVCQSHLEFMRWADNTLLAALKEVPGDRVGHDLGSSFKSLFGTLNHVYLAELIWLRRVRGEPAARMADLPHPADLEELAQVWPGLHQTWIDWARSLSTEGWNQTLHFRTLQGIEAQLPLWQIAMHLVNHGSYHRGQLATMLRQSGMTPPGTDLLTFYRTH
jgi:uncharacterized damage-inducible protein DinB